MSDEDSFANKYEELGMRLFACAFFALGFVSGFRFGLRFKKDPARA